MLGKRFYSPAVIQGWMIVIYEIQHRFNDNAVANMKQGLLDSFEEVGMYPLDLFPYFSRSSTLSPIKAFSAVKRTRSSCARTVKATLPM